VNADQQASDGSATVVTARRPPSADEIDIVVYLSEASQGATVQAAVRVYLDAIGFEITQDEEPVISSWFWRGKARRLGRAAADSELGHSAGVLAESLAFGPVRSRQAEINLVNSQAVANLIQSLAGTPTGLILAGSVLVVKHGDVPIVVTLNQAQVNLLERRPYLLRQPETVLEDLTREWTDADFGENPPSLVS
jgi:hypothetical protein